MDLRKSLIASLSFVVVFASAGLTRPQPSDSSPQQPTVPQRPIERVSAQGVKSILASDQQLEDHVKSIFRAPAGMEVMAYSYQGAQSPGFVIIGAPPAEISAIRRRRNNPVAPRPSVTALTRNPDPRALKRLEEAKAAPSKLRSKDLRGLMEQYNRASAGVSNPKLSADGQALLKHLGQLTATRK